MDSNTIYSIDDWVVHSYYGVGQINRIEVKPINEEETKCFKVKTSDSTYWFSATDTDNPRIRPVASQDILAKVFKNLRSKANVVDPDRTLWKSKIEEVQAGGDLLSISILIRDLSTQQMLRDLNQTEKNALEHFKERLLREWASIVDEDVETLRSTLNGYILESQAKTKVD